MILAVNGKRKLSEYYRALRSGGKAVMIGGSLTQVFGTMVFGFLYAGGGRRLLTLAAKENAADSAYLAGLVAEGKIAPAIEKVVTLEEGVEAFHYVEGGHAQGKVVIRIG